MLYGCHWCHWHCSGATLVSAPMSDKINSKSGRNRKLFPKIINMALLQPCWATTDCHLPAPPCSVLFCSQSDTIIIYFLFWPLIIWHILTNEFFNDFFLVELKFSSTEPMCHLHSCLDSEVFCLVNAKLGFKVVIYVFVAATVVELTKCKIHFKPVSHYTSS